MAEKQHKRKRQTLRAQGLDPFPAPNHNTDPEAIDTRADRRDKQFRKKKIAAQTKATSPLEILSQRAKWNRAFNRLFNATQIKAINRELREAEAE